MSVVIDRPAPQILRIRIARPSARNAIDGETRRALLSALESGASDTKVRAVVLGGVEGMFCAGGDLPSLVGIDHRQALDRMRDGHQVVSALWSFPKPVVAAVERFAIGAGAGLALLSDEIVVGRSAVIGFPFIRLGLLPDWGLMGSLPMRTGAITAARLFREAAQVTGDRLLALNIADQVVDDADVMAVGVQSAERLAKLPPQAFAHLKIAMRGSAEDALGLSMEAVSQADCLVSREFAEGYAALLEKRDPVF